MVPFAYARMASIATATATGARHRSDGAHEPGADFFAGGTDMMQLMGEHLRNPDRIIDISALPGLAIASAAVALDLAEDGTVRDVRVAVGRVATKPWRLPQVEAALQGSHPTAARIEEAASYAADGAVAHGGNIYKADLMRRTVIRALAETGTRT